MADETPKSGPIRRVGILGFGEVGRFVSRRLAEDAADLGLEKIAVFDDNPAALALVEDSRLTKSASLAHLVDAVDLALVCLPSGADLGKAARRHDGLLDCARSRQIFVDLGSSPPAMARQLATAFAARGAAFLDGPMLRLGDGSRPTLAIGGDAAAIQAAEPILRRLVAEIIPVGAPGAGQVARRLDDMVRLQTVAAFAEALATARAVKLESGPLLQALAKGGDAGATPRRLGLKALAGEGGRLTIKEARGRLDEGIQLAEGLGLSLDCAKSARAWFDKAIAMDLGESGLCALLETAAPPGGRGRERRRQPA
jgi:3-hydroxyisobutyrate dehydrogenase-like beta-hydroxyacid dehydrogenase